MIDLSVTLNGAFKVRALVKYFILGEPNNVASK